MAGAKESAEVWERTVDLVVRRVTYSAAAGACAAVVLFRTPGANSNRLHVCCARAVFRRPNVGPQRSQLRAQPLWRSVPAWVLEARSRVRRAAYRSCGLIRHPETLPLTRRAALASEAAHLQKDVGAR